MENEKYLKDLTEIKNMMSQSSRFISLSGLSGVFAGIYAIAGAVVAAKILSYEPSVYSDSGSYVANANTDLVQQLVTVAVAVLILAIGTAIVLTTRKAKKQGKKIWDSTSRRLILNFFAPLFAGGMLMYFEKQSKIK